ncbi:hypothetical protein M5K25_027539 [Dendrobium thyrsiflorum]|uniref:Uncharacterized protein n=1 Tax=Dendrobium thyrsiflorum TaxID=117978 RepID=A0ABD0TU03_DENTH
MKSLVEIVYKRKRGQDTSGEPNYLTVLKNEGPKPFGLFASSAERRRRRGGGGFGGEFRRPDLEKVEESKRNTKEINLLSDGCEKTVHLPSSRASRREVLVFYFYVKFGECMFVIIRTPVVVVSLWLWIELMFRDLYWIC